jgi:hypothetical protein
VYKVDHRAYADLDHLPIRTLLEINLLELADPIRRRNWKAIDVEKFLAFVLVNLHSREWISRLTSPYEID